MLELSLLPVRLRREVFNKLNTENFNFPLFFKNKRSNLCYLSLNSTSIQFTASGCNRSQSSHDTYKCVNNLFKVIKGQCSKFKIFYFEP
jgi:hypothetical protein